MGFWRVADRPPVRFEPVANGVLDGRISTSSMLLEPNGMARGCEALPFAPAIPI